MITCNKTNPPVKIIQQKLLWGSIAQDRFNDVNRKCHKMQVRNLLLLILKMRNVNPKS